MRITLIVSMLVALPAGAVAEEQPPRTFLSAGLGHTFDLSRTFPIDPSVTYPAALLGLGYKQKLRWFHAGGRLEAVLGSSDGQVSGHPYLGLGRPVFVELGLGGGLVFSRRPNRKRIGLIAVGHLALGAHLSERLTILLRADGVFDGVLFSASAEWSL